MNLSIIPDWARGALLVVVFTLIALTLAYCAGSAGTSGKVATAENATAAARQETRVAVAQSTIAASAARLNDQREASETQTRDTAQEATDALSTASPARLLPDYLAALQRLRDQDAARRGADGPDN